MAVVNKYDNIPAEKFQFAKKVDLSHDKKFDTKPVSYFQGAFRRFSKNKGAVVGGIIAGNVGAVIGAAYQINKSNKK